MTNTDILNKYKKEHGLKPNYELYSPQAWWAMGYKVIKGSVCKHRVKMVPRGGKPYLKEYSLFSRDQVEAR